jgi:hypothetical protein
MRSLLSLAILAALPAMASAVEIDGRIDPAEWEGARHVTDFRLTQPLSREPTPHPTEAWIKATPDGLAVAWRNMQAASVERRRQRSQRDQGGPTDRVNLYVDFDGDGRTGYNFTLSISDSIQDGTITNENQFNNDWDGPWLHAVSEDEAGWSAEMLIPWHIAPMQQSAGESRVIALQLDRVIGATNERMSWPTASFTEPRFLSVLEKIEVPKYSQSLLAITPYVAGIQDLVGHSSNFDGGADIFWKPNGQFQLSATINPDFGQVESDQLVVNFGAVETFFSDKRPFFTENQSFFDVPFGGLGNANRLIYTRRVGGPEDDGDGSGDVSAALKLNGSAAGFNYGLFLADEGGDDGREFYAARVTRDFAEQGIGMLLTRVERPFLDRIANVAAFDHRWNPRPNWTIRSAVVGSEVEQGGRTVRDSGGQMRIDHVIGDGWRQQLYAVHLGDSLQLNDFGYLDRNNFNYARYELAKRLTSLPESSPFASHEVRGAVSRRVNDDGVHIADAWAFNRFSERRDGGNQFMEVAGWTSGVDDLITRGNGLVRVPSKLFGFAERFIPRRGKWELYGNMRYSADGLGGWDDGSLTVFVQPTYHFTDSANVGIGLELRHHPDWLLWRDDTRAGFTPSLATYRSNMALLNAGATWLIDSKQELRVRLEALGLDAKSERSYALAPDGTPIDVGNRHADFALRNMGFQVRYRYELASLSYLYVAYVRGGGMLDEGLAADFRYYDQFRDAFELRDSEQLLVKLSYRFEI